SPIELSEAIESEKVGRERHIAALDMPFEDAEAPCLLRQMQQLFAVAAGGHPGRSSAAQHALGRGHRLELAEGGLAGQMIQAAGAGNDGLFGGEPAMSQDALGHGLTGFDLWILDIDGTDTK